MSKEANLILSKIYKKNKITPKGLLKYKAKSKRVNPFCYSPPKKKKTRDSMYNKKNFKKSLSRKKLVKPKSMKKIFKSIRNFKIPKIKKIDEKKKRVKFVIPQKKSK